MADYSGDGIYGRQTMEQNFSDDGNRRIESSDHSSRAVAAKALDLLTQESAKDLLSSSTQPRLVPASRENAAGARQSKSYLETWIDATTSTVLSNEDTRNTANQLAVDFCKTASLFTGGKIGLAGTFIAYGLDQAHPDDNWKTQAADFALGGAKGEAMRGMFAVVGSSAIPAPLKGALMGITSGTLNEVMKRETFTDPASLTGRLERSAFDPHVILMNAAVFTAGQGLYSGIDLATKGALAESPMIAGMVMGGSFGFVNGTVHETTRQLQQNGTIEPGKILLHGVLDAGVSAAGAGVGMKISDPVFQQEVKESFSKALDKVRLNPFNRAAQSELLDSISAGKAAVNFSDKQSVQEFQKSLKEVEALVNELKPALETYHTAGRSNGGGVDGIQLPPGVNKEQLPEFIQKLTSFLAVEKGIDVKLPAAGQTAEEVRTEIEHQSANAVKEHARLYLSTAVDKIENRIISEMVREALRQAPPEFFTAPSSSSGKHHPADEINVGGLSLHTLRTVLMGEKLIDFYNQDAGANVVGNQKIAGEQQDLILGALVVHDIMKGGIPWKKYDPAHGPEGAAFLKGIWQSNPRQDFSSKMQELVYNHMAQWTKAPGNIPEPKPPRDFANQIASYADYLGSQKNVYVGPLPGSN